MKIKEGEGCWWPTYEEPEAYHTIIIWFKASAVGGGSGFGEVSQGLASRGLAVSLSLAVGAKNDARISENGGMMML